MDTEKELPVLSPEEIRVLGCLIEKSKTTPDYYPMTVNSIAAACNQKTSRKPVVDYSEEAVMKALSALKAISLVSTAVGGGSRSVKYKHNFTTVIDVSDAELAILCLLFLRGAQTPGELNTNSGRIYEFSSLEEVMSALEKLMNAEPPFVKELPRQAGQKEKRFVHLFGDSTISEEHEIHSGPTEKSASALENLESRLAAMEKGLAEMKALLDQLLK